MPEKYFSERAGRETSYTLELDDLYGILEVTFRKFDREGYFQYQFGKKCEDQGFIPGKQGFDLETSLTLRFGNRGKKLLPTSENVGEMGLEDIFDIIEYLYDYVAKPVQSRIHTWNGCGIHVRKSSVEEGQAEWSEFWNGMLSRLNPAYRIEKHGAIELLPESSGLASLVDNMTPYHVPDKVDNKVERACRLFLHWKSTIEDKKEAIRELADVLELLRTELNEVAPEKEVSSLFNIANNYGIRHWNEKQETKFSREEYYPWIFHSYLAMIDLISRLKLMNESNR